jgi:hypothetical protein
MSALIGLMADSGISPRLRVDLPLAALGMAIGQSGIAASFQSR